MSARVSIIMVFLNARRFMDEAIKSVEAQTFTDWELVLVDDGSDDGSNELAAGHVAADPARIRLVQHPDRGNHGTGASRNLGLSVATGEFVAFLDADDVYLPQRLEIHVALLERHPEAVMVQSCVEYWYSWSGGKDGRRVDVRETAPPVPIDAPVGPPHLLVLMLRSKGHAVPAICSLTIRLDAARRVGGFEDAFRHAYEDQVMLAKLYLSASTLVIGDVLARYRQHPESLVHRLEREGTYVPGWPNPAHRAFVDWLQDYVAARGVADRSLHAALREEQWPYHHPWAWRLRNLPALSMRGVRRLAQRMVPAAVLEPLLDWRRLQKEAAAAQRATKEGQRIADALRPQSRSRGRN